MFTQGMRVLHQGLSSDAEPASEEVPMTNRGMAGFLPLANGARHDYQFHGSVKACRSFDHFLGESGWEVRTTVMRIPNASPEELDLDIFITKRTWGEQAPPQVGQDIQGTLWLQGHLWYPHAWGKLGQTK